MPPAPRSGDAFSPFSPDFEPLRAASDRPFPDDDDSGDRRKGPDRRGLATNRRNRMTKIITCSELRYRTMDELEALFRTLQIESGRTAPGSPERTIVLASLESVRASWRRHASAGSRSGRRREHGRFSLGPEAASSVPRLQLDGGDPSPIRSEARCFRAVRRARSGRDWRPPHSSAGRRSRRRSSNYAA
jgi:hypothetical protein